MSEVAVTRQLLEAARARHALALDFAPVGTLTLDDGLRVREAGLIASTYLGGEVRELVGRTLSSIVEDLDEPRVREWYTRAIQGGLVATLETGFVVPARGPAVVELSGLPCGDGDATVLRVLMVDLTARARLEEERAHWRTVEREAREQATEATRFKDGLLAMVSHDLRTPLAAILMGVDVLRRSTADNEKQRRIVNAIEQSARMQQRLIADLLDVSRSRSRKLRLDLCNVQAGDAVQASLDAIRPQADAKEVMFAVSIDPATPPLHADPERLQQILGNLLENAVRHSNRGGLVQVDARGVGPVVQLVVRDEGRGIAPDLLSQVFEPFRQGVSTPGELGLGLAIVRELVHLHGGRVTAASDGEGRGATFTVAIPAALEPDEEPVLAALDTPDDDLPLAGRYVLLVEDDDSSRDACALALELHGAEVKATASAAEAFASFTTRLPDLLLSDLAMPGEDGYSLMRRVRRLSPEQGGGVHAIALSAHVGDESRRAAIEAGFHRHLSKPVDPSELVSLIASLCRTLAPR